MSQLDTKLELLGEESYFITKNPSPTVSAIESMNAFERARETLILCMRIKVMNNSEIIGITSESCCMAAAGYSPSIQF